VDVIDRSNPLLSSSFTTHDCDGVGIFHAHFANPETEGILSQDPCIIEHAVCCFYYVFQHKFFSSIWDVG